MDTSGRAWTDRSSHFARFESVIAYRVSLIRKRSVVQVHVPPAGRRPWRPAEVMAFSRAGAAEDAPRRRATVLAQPGGRADSHSYSARFANGSCSEFVLVPCRRSDWVSVVDDVEVRDRVAVRFEG